VLIKPGLADSLPSSIIDRRNSTVFFSVPMWPKSAYISFGSKDVDFLDDAGGLCIEECQ
jgi:hypothetical protein